MTSKIPTIYTDKLGSLDAEIINDFQQLKLDINGMKFTGNTFDDFTPDDIDNTPSRFKLNQHKELSDCNLFCKIPLLISQRGNETVGVLNVDIHLNTADKTYDTYSLFKLFYGNEQVEIGRAQHFESAFDILKNKLPATVFPKCCYTCQYSDFSVYGSSIFGSMMCFRNIKKLYLDVKTKDEYMEIMDQREMHVQEIYLCNEFEKRIEGTGYRG